MEPEYKWNWQYENSQVDNDVEDSLSDEDVEGVSALGLKRHEADEPIIEMLA